MCVLEFLTLVLQTREKTLNSNLSNSAKKLTMCHILPMPRSLVRFGSFFYGMSTNVGYLMLNPFLYIKTVLLQTIQFSISTIICLPTIKLFSVISLRGSLTLLQGCIWCIIQPQPTMPAGAWYIYIYIYIYICVCVCVCVCYPFILYWKISLLYSFLMNYT